MELTGVSWVLAAAGFLLWTGGSAAPLECHFDSRGETPLPGNVTRSFAPPPSSRPTCDRFHFAVAALCVFEGRRYTLGETWMDNACMQCTCLHPVGVGCCET